MRRVLPNRKVVMAAFDRGQVPRIACINKATVDLRLDFDRLVPALQKFLDAHFVPVWGTPAKAQRFAREDREMHRSEYRKTALRAALRAAPRKLRARD